MSKVRRMLFPIMNWELPKFLPMAAIIFLTIFTFTMLRTIKDGLVVTNMKSAETLAYIKAGLVLPASILGSLLYIKVRASATFERTYYIVVSIFLTFFALFWLYLYPNMDSFHMTDEQIKDLQVHAPVLRFVFPILGKWIYALYYTFTELWGSFCLSVLFWQFANDNCGHRSKILSLLFCRNIVTMLHPHFVAYINNMNQLVQRHLKWRF